MPRASEEKLLLRVLQTIASSFFYSEDEKPTLFLKLNSFIRATVFLVIEEGGFFGFSFVSP